MARPDPDSPSDAEDDSLPVAVESTRTYLTVRPAEDALSAANVTAHVRRLHRLTESEESDSILGGLFERSTAKTLECLLISDGEADTLTYAFTIDDEDALDGLERILRGLFPDTYHLEREEYNEAFLGRLLGATAEEPPTTGEGRERAASAGTPIEAIEFCGAPERRRDYRTTLTPFEAFLGEENGRIPLATVVETMAESAAPMVYQALVRPMDAFSGAVESYQRDIEANHDTIGGQIENAIFGPPDEEWTPGRRQQERIDDLADKEATRAFALNARVVAIDPDGGTGDETQDQVTDPAREARRELASAFADVGGTFYDVEGVSTRNPGQVYREIRSRTFHSPSYEQTRTMLPGVSTRCRAIVADAGELPNFLALDGEALTAAGARTVAPTPGERTAIARPPFEVLQHYQTEGFLLGYPLTQDGSPAEQAVSIPPELQPLHMGMFGKTGSGKSTALINAMLENHAATGGASILIDPKGDGMATDYLRAHVGTYGSLDDVLYFDCAELLPAFSFFDIRDELDAGIARTTAVSDRVDHYLEILTQIMGRERFEQAVRSPDVIRYLTKAMFDPVSGSDAFAHEELHSAVRLMHERKSAPPVSDDDLERMLAGVVANRARSFDEIMQGVANRIEKIPVDRRLARIFNHVPDEGDPQFDLVDVLDEDVVVVFDTGDLRSEAQRVLTLVVLSNLWTALRRRSRRGAADGRETDDHPLVNLYVEEAASVAASDLLSELLAQSRGFDCSVTLSMQFPAQLRGADEGAYDELLNNISTFVTGNVPNDRRLAERLATDEMRATDIGNRLRALRRGQWLVSLPAAFDEAEPQPFLLRSADPPPGDPAGDRPLSQRDARTFETELAAVETRTETEAGLRLAAPSATGQDDGGDSDETKLEDRVDSALPYTRRMPPTVTYSESIHALRCTDCNNRYDPDIDGMRRAIECCSSLDAVDRDDIPICEVNLKLTPDERAASEWSDRQLLFMQAVYNAQQLRYDDLEYDLLTDSMLRLQEYVGIDTAPIQDLVDADVLRHGTDHPHRLYTVTPEGRSVIGESYREGVDYGHGAGDLEESSEHVFAVEVGRQYLEAEYAENSDSPVVEVVPYYDLDDRHRLDIAGLDSEGDIVVVVEAERVNHDVSQAVPEDYDKMAACDPEAAIWVVMKQADGHAVLQALNDPPDGDPRVEKTYAKTTPPQQFRIDSPGLTAIYPASWLRDTVLEADH